MKNWIKLFVIAAVAVVGVIGIGSAATQTGFASGEASSPRSLYLQNCSKCHGADGRADTPKGRETDADDLTSASTKRWRQGWAPDSKMPTIVHMSPKLQTRRKPGWSALPAPNRKIMGWRLNCGLFRRWRGSSAKAPKRLAIRGWHKRAKVPSGEF